MNYYPFHIGDYASATRHLTWEEDCAFRRLLDVYYVSEKPLPVELRAVCRLVLATTEEQREAVKVVLEEFFILTDKGWVNERADAELDAMRVKQQIAKDKANKRWDKHKKELSNASAMPQHEESNATASKEDADAMLPTPTPTPTPLVNNNKRAMRFDAQAHLLNLCVPADLASDWIKLRKAKKAEVTKTAIDGIESEALKAGISLDAALRECCSRGWAGFKADWIANSQPNQRASPFQNIHDQRAETIATLTGRNRNERTNERDISGEAIRVA